MSKIDYSEFEGFDFGFTAVDSDEVSKPTVDQAVEETNTQLLDEFRSKLKELEKLILPLLVNLQKNPEKDFINWPNRKPAIDKQIEKIIKITRAYEN